MSATRPAGSRAMVSAPASNVMPRISCQSRITQVFLGVALDHTQLTLNASMIATAVSVHIKTAVTNNRHTSATILRASDQNPSASTKACRIRAPSFNESLASSTSAMPKPTITSAPRPSGLRPMANNTAITAMAPQICQSRRGRRWGCASGSIATGRCRRGRNCKSPTWPPASVDSVRFPKNTAQTRASVASL